MPAEVLFVGGRIDSVVQTAAVENTSASVQESAFTDAALQITSGGSITVDLYTATANVLAATTVVSGEVFWLHLCWYSGSSLPNQDCTLFTVNDSSGFPWVRVRYINSTATLILQYNSGTGASPTWTSFGGSIPYFTTQVVQRLDLRIALGSPHQADFYVQSVATAMTGSFTQASFTNVAEAVISPPLASPTIYISQIAATRDISTIGCRVRNLRATANGANTAWAGVFTDVNEAVTSDASVNSSGTAGQKETHAMGDNTTGGGLKLKSIWHWLRAKNDGAAPNNIKSVLRLSAVDYSTGNLSGIGLAYGPVGARYDQNPATSADWADAGWNAAEAGYESAT